MIRILHFSDLHINGNYDQNTVLKCFLKDIENNKFDLVICSGDIAAKGDFSKKENILGFFKELKRIVGNIPIVTCPGNHDVNLNKRNKIFNDLFNIENPKKANEFFDGLYLDPNDQLLTHLKDYNEIAGEINELDLNNKIFFTKKIIINNKKIGVASLNSSWLTKGGGRADHGNLFISRRQVERAHDEIEDCEIKIAIFHHPLEWLNHEEKSYIQSSLVNKFNLAFCGHIHDNNVSLIATNIGNMFTSNTGCLYQTREFFNGYSIVEINDQCINVTAREYFDRREVFDISSRFSEDGKSSFTLEKKNCKSLNLVSGELLRQISTNANTKLLSINSGVAPQELSFIFVEPPLSYKDEKTHYASKGKKEVDKKISLIKLENLYGSKNNILFLGKRESGKTTLLNYIISNKFNYIYNSTEIGIVVDLASARTPDKNLTLNTIIMGALNFLEGTLNKSQIVDLLNSGKVLLGFDNLNVNSENDLNVLKEFINKYNQCFYIAVAQEPEINLKNHKYEEELFKEQIYIHSFKKKETELLVQKWFNNDIEAGRSNLRVVKKLIDQLNVPSTPFLISMLLWVVEKEKNNSNLFNEASVVQVLIEGLLNKFGETKKREVFDSTNLSHFLKEFAYLLDTKGKTSITIGEFDNFKISYFNEKGLEPNENFRKDLVDKGIIYSDTANVSFKFDCFRAFFLAEKFNTDENIWEDIILNKKIHSYAVEFEYYSGIYRDRHNLLKILHESMKGIFDDLNLNQIEVDTNGLISTNLFGGVPEHLEENSSIIESEIEIPNKASIDHSASREKSVKPETSEHYNALVALRTFAAVVRNSELVAFDIKKHALDDLFNYWNDFFLFLIEMTKKDISSLNFDDSIHNKAKVTEFFTLLIMFVYSYLIVEKSSSPKLKKILEGYFNSENAGHRALAILCYTEIDLLKAIDITKRSIPFFIKKKFYLQVIYIFYMHKFFENGQFIKSKVQADAIKLILAELSYGIGGQEKRFKSYLISKKIEELEGQKREFEKETAE